MKSTLENTKNLRLIQSEVTEILRHSRLGFKLAALHAFKEISAVAVDEKDLRAARASAVVDLRAVKQRKERGWIFIGIYFNGNSFHN